VGHIQTIHDHSWASDASQIIMDDDTICHTTSKASAAFPLSIFPISVKIC